MRWCWRRNRVLLLQIAADVQILKGLVEQMKVDLTNLQNAVAAEQGAVDSAIALIEGFTAEIQKLINASGPTVDPAELQALADQFNASSKKLADSVAANPLPPA